MYAYIKFNNMSLLFCNAYNYIKHFHLCGRGVYYPNFKKVRAKLTLTFVKNE